MTTGEDHEAPAWAQRLMAKVESIDLKFDKVNDSIKSVRDDVRAVLNRVKNAEVRISNLEDTSARDKDVIKELTKNVEYLKAKQIQLESYSRRNNLVLFGLDEGLLEGNDQKEVMCQILRYILDVAPGDPVPEVERQHRSLRPRPDPPQPPRPYLLRLLRWEDRQRILRAAAKKKRLLWKEKPFYVNQDLPVELQRKRADYGEIRRKLRATGHRYGLLHPARLIVTIDGKTHVYRNAEEANEELKKLLPDKRRQRGDLTPFHISWLPLSIVDSSQFLGICALPDELRSQGVQDAGFRVHHRPFPDGAAPDLELCCRILEELKSSLDNNRRTVIHCYGGLGRSGLIVACLLLQLSLTMTPNKAIEILREHRGGGAIQTVKQYNFLHEFRDSFSSYEESREAATERCVSR
ncbi:hypothetical protein WMY93_017759 [Mugilogobius chulae]|uniref:protein-tyrosine-phosphatase n=1 Tax=Mugilogobius chulae TaxID=88201 RepID=A0AAW0NTZ1_9GOBI